MTFKATKQSRATHVFRGCRSVIQRFLALVVTSKASTVALGLCWHRAWLTMVSVIAAELISWLLCPSFRSLWVFSCLLPSWCWSSKAKQKCLMCLSLKSFTSSHGIMGIRALPALKMPCLWLVCDDQLFVCQGLSVYHSIILRSEEKMISWKSWDPLLQK